MGIGIQICGLNGCGKSTLGKALAARTGYYFIDNENLYFSRTANTEPYANPRSRQEVERLLMDEVHAHPDFIFAAVKGDYTPEILALYDYVILIEVPQEVRIQRIRNRSFEKFGNRMLAGGDLHEQEEAFFQLAASRPHDYAERWLHGLTCPVIRVDGTKPINENVEYILQQLQREDL